MKKRRVDVTSCGCLVFRRNGDDIEVVLVRPFSNRDVWGVPKGHMDAGESFVDCAKREVFEETGLDVDILPDTELPLCFTRNQYENKTVRTFVAVAKDPTRELVGDGENFQIGWFSISRELPTIHKYQVEMINAGIKVIREICRSLETIT